MNCTLYEFANQTDFENISSSIKKEKQICRNKINQNQLGNSFQRCKLVNSISNKLNDKCK